jgi:heme oxygenase (biliverdin-IX-beta and delta-forming)
VRQISKTMVRLNIETRAFHADADAPWLDLLAESSMRLDYIEHLATCYGIDASIEAALAYTPHLPSLVDLHPRFRAGYIAEDLLNLGVSPAAIAALPQAMIAPFANVSEAFGWLYVHQRSTLLHDGVRTQLLERFPELACATGYLRRNDGRVGILWDELGSAVDKVARTPQIEDRIVTSAIDASRTVVQWYRQSGQRQQREAARS